MITRYVLINYSKKQCEAEAFASENEAWKHIVDKCRGTEDSPYDWDVCPVEMHVR